MLNNDFLVTLISVISFAGLGTFIRTGLSQLVAPFNFFSLVPNLVGSFILGLTKGSSLNNQYIAKGIGTGLCGSITTFSSFNYEFNVLLINNSDPDVPLALFFITVTFIGSAIAFYAGESLSKFTAAQIRTNLQSISDTKSTELETVSINDTNHKQTTGTKEDKEEDPTKMEKDKTDTINVSSRSQIEQKGGVQFKLIMTWLMVLVIMNIIVIPLCFVIDNKLWLAALLAPFGAALRWYLGLRLNKNNGFNLPIGTLIANIVGSALLTSVIVASHESEDANKETIWIEAITKGFCGCLSTVSSFVGELFTLRRDAQSKGNNQDEEEDAITVKKHITTCKVSVIYFFLTIVIAQILSAIPNGINVWG